MPTKIEWCDETWNPIRTADSGYHCTKLSEGCQNCYAERMNKRFGNLKPFDNAPAEFVLNQKQLHKPLHWEKPRRVFVQSMGDLFHEDVPFMVIAKVFRIMHTSKHHTFMVLTKRPKRMKEFIEWFIGPEWRGAWPQEYPHVWLGVTCENQTRADERIPVLLQIPAAKRFVSVEPMLGSVDLTKWIMPRTPFTPENAPETWEEYIWPDWVPDIVRNSIENFWSQAGRKPKDWAENAINNDSPPFGMEMVYKDSHDDAPVYGKWVFAWNNMGRLVGEHGEVFYPSIPRTSLFDATRYYWHSLHWIICGGETGPGARPIHPDWARSLRDQCQVAGTPFFFKSWGNYCAPSQMPEDTYRGWDYHHGTENCWQEDDPTPWEVGKKAAGHLIDGQEWRQFPEVEI